MGERLKEMGWKKIYQGNTNRKKSGRSSNIRKKQTSRQK